MTTIRNLSPYFKKEVKEISRWSLPSANDTASFVSWYFNGTATLTIGDNTLLEIGSSDFTVECWVRVSSYPSIAGTICGKGATGSSTGEYVISISPSGVASFAYSSTGSSTFQVIVSSATALKLNTWYHVAFVKSSTTYTVFINGQIDAIATGGPGTITGRTGAFYISGSSFGLTGNISNLRIVKSAVYSKDFQIPINPSAAIPGTSLLTCCDITFIDRSSNALALTNSGTVVEGNSPFTSPFLKMLDEGVQAGQLFIDPYVSTYSLPYTAGIAYYGGVLASNGDIHFVPYSAIRGQKVSPTGVVSTYSLIYTLSTGAYIGGVLASNGDIHFVPYSAIRGQKVSATGVVSTYSLVYTATGAYSGGVLAPNGDIHFVPNIGVRGQKVSAAGVVSTYSIIHTHSSGAYLGGVLATNGDIHFIPFYGSVGQKISTMTNVVSTYSLIHTNSSGAYAGGVFAPNGDIHFVPFNANVGQKVSSAGVVSTYSLAYTASGAYVGGVLAPNGDIHFVPSSAAVGQKVSASGVVSTYSLRYTASIAYSGGVLTPQNEIHFIPLSGVRGQKLTLNNGVNFSKGVCSSPFFNKL